MPYINVKVTDEEVTRNQKKSLVEGTTKPMVEILDKDAKTKNVVIGEVPVDNWGVCITTPFLWNQATNKPVIKLIPIRHYQNDE